MTDRKTLIDVTNVTDNTYYTRAYSPDGFDTFTWEIIGHGGSGTVTLKIFATLEADATPTLATTATTYVDITLDTFSVASYVCGAGVTTRHLVRDELKKLAGYKWVRWQYVCNTGGANDADLKILQAFVKEVI